MRQNVRLFPDASRRSLIDALRMDFTVERELLGSWDLVTGAIAANDAAQAVARACSDPGLYRASPIGTSGLHEHFMVPSWGPPEPVEPGLD